MHAIVVNHSQTAMIYEKLSWLVEAGNGLTGVSHAWCWQLELAKASVS
jgi:hypothetical protein